MEIFKDSKYFIILNKYLKILLTSMLILCARTSIFFYNKPNEHVQYIIH